MLKSILVKTALTTLLLGSLNASANVIVDVFEDDQDSQSIQGGTTDNYAVGAGILGGERDIILTAGGRVTANSKVQFDELLIGSDAASSGTAAELTFTAEVQWDGIDGSSDLNLSPGIVPAADFSSLDGFSATVNLSDGSGSFEVFIYNAAGEETSVILPFSPVTAGAPVTFAIPFTLFSPEIDLSQIVAITLKLTAMGNTDIVVGAISAVPTPSSLAVLGLGLLGFAGFARRKS
jgi:hypothetical protein